MFNNTGTSFGDYANSTDVEFGSLFMQTPFDGDESSSENHSSLKSKLRDYALNMAALLALFCTPVPAQSSILSIPSSGPHIESRCESTSSNAQSMVAALKSKGMPIAAIAEVVQVERKTVYSWLDSGVEPTRGNNFERLASLGSAFASEETGSLRFYHRFWQRSLSGGRTLKAILTAENIDIAQAREAIDELRPSVQRAMVNAVKRASRSRDPSPASHLTIDLEAGSWA